MCYFKKSSPLYIVLLLCCLQPHLQAQNTYEPSHANLEARQWFQDAKLGLFVHWGVYSIIGGGGDENIAEWVMEQQQIPINDYEQLPRFFNPTQFDVRKWVNMVKEAGFKYITITSKHHDGFAMYDSDVSDYNIVDQTPYGKDILKMLAEECRKQGIKLFFYYSQLDWHHPDYWPRGRTGNNYTGRPENGDWSNYLNYMNTQLRELLTNYGEIGGIWFDGMWDKPDADWQLQKTYSMIHELQPQALIGSNHHEKPNPGEDFQMFERDLPGQNTTGWQGTHISQLPLETAATISDTWGFNLVDNDFKSVKTLIRFMVKAAGYNSNFLLNVGPMPNGEIQPMHSQRLSAIGYWLEEYGQTIYGTRGGPMAPKEWGVTTQKDDGKTVYLHFFDYSGEAVLVDGIKEKPTSVTLLKNGQTLSHQHTKHGVLIHIPYKLRDEIDTIIEIKVSN